MAKWIEVPAHRILEVESDEFREEYQRLDSNGEIAQEGAAVELILRNRDGRRFKLAKFFPLSDFRMMIYLEEL
jgi:hypothetical protein